MSHVHVFRIEPAPQASPPFHTFEAHVLKGHHRSWPGFPESIVGFECVRDGDAAEAHVFAGTNVEIRCCGVLDCQSVDGDVGVSVTGVSAVTVQLECGVGFTEVVAAVDGVVGDGDVVDVVTFSPRGEFGAEVEGAVCYFGYVSHKDAVAPRAMDRGYAGILPPSKTLLAITPSEALMMAPRPRLPAWEISATEHSVRDGGLYSMCLPYRQLFTFQR